MAIVSGGFLLFPLFAIVFLMLASWWPELGGSKRPRTAYAMFTAMVAIIASLAYAHRMPGLIAPLLVSPALLLVTHRYRDHNQAGRSLHRLGVAYILLSLCVAVFYLPVHGLLFAAVAVLVLLGLLNNQFYVFLAAKRSVLFMLAAIPFHLLYHFYNGVSFIIGLVHYSWMAAFARSSPQPHTEGPGTTAGPSIAAASPCVRYLTCACSEDRDLTGATRSRLDRQVEYTVSQRHGRLSRGRARDQSCWGDKARRACGSPLPDLDALVKALGMHPCLRQAGLSRRKVQRLDSQAAVVRKPDG